MRYLPSNGKGAATRPHQSRWSQLPQLVRFPKGHEMKALGIAAATAIALAPFSVVATTPDVAQAAPCAGVFANPTSCQNCLLFVEEYHTSNVCDKAAPSRPAQAPPSVMPAQAPEAPPEPALPSVMPVQTPEVVPPSPPPPHDSASDPEDQSAGPWGAKKRLAGDTAEGAGCVTAGGRGCQGRTGDAD